jgi:hypothetical protein
MNLRDLVPSAAALEPQAISLDVLREKYCKDNETSIEDVNARVANALADVEPERRDQHREAFCGHCSRASCRPVASSPPQARPSRPRSSTASCSRWATPSRKSTMAIPASTPR